MTIGEFFQQNAAAIITAVPATIFSLGSFLSSIDAMLNTRRNRRIANEGRFETDRKVDDVKVAVENGYHAAVTVAADVAAVKVIEKAKEVAALLEKNAYMGPERRSEDTNAPDGVERREPRKVE